jgi:hypothetical protein
VRTSRRVGVSPELKAVRLNGTVRRSASHKRRTARNSHASSLEIAGWCGVSGTREGDAAGGERSVMSAPRCGSDEGKYGTEAVSVFLSIDHVYL